MSTIGQRKSLPGGSVRHRYVVDIEPETNRVSVGNAEDLVREEFEIEHCNWIVPINGEPKEITVKIRYSHGGTAATVIPLGGDRARIRLHQPQRAVTPGQAAVVYDADRVVGGGWICRAEPFRQTEPARQTESADNGTSISRQAALRVA